MSVGDKKGVSGPLCDVLWLDTLVEGRDCAVDVR